MVLLIHRVSRSLVKCPRMDDTADHPHESGVIAAGAVLLLAGVLGILLMTTGSDIALADDLDAVSKKVYDTTNVGFYTYIVFWSIMISLVGAGLAAVAVLLARAGGAARAMGAAAATLAGISAALMVLVPVVYSALVNEWSPDDDTRTDGYAVEVLESIPFGASQAGFGVLTACLIALAVAFFTSGELNRMIGMAPMILSLFTIAFLEYSQGVSNILLPVIALIVGIPVFCSGLLSRREEPPSVKKPLGTVPPTSRSAAPEDRRNG